MVTIVVIFALFYLFTRPESAAEAVKTAGGAVGNAFDSIITFFNALSSPEWNRGGRAGVAGGFFDPKVTSHLISDQGEIIIDEVQTAPDGHRCRRSCNCILAALILFSALVRRTALRLGADRARGVIVVLFAVRRILSAHMDRFVITNMRVFRVHGIFAQQTATMPMSRILDITVDKPFDRTDLQLRSLHLRDGGPGPGPAVDPLRRAAGRARSDHPAGDPAIRAAVLDGARAGGRG